MSVGERLYVVVEPEFDPASLAALQAIRRRYDPQVVLIGPHVTLLFAARAELGANLSDGLRRLAHQISPFAAAFGETQLHASARDGAHYLYLLPKPAAAERLKVLFTRIQTMLPTSAVDHFERFVPHITLGRFADRPTALRAQAAVLPLAPCEGEIRDLRLLASTAGNIQELVRLPLGSGGLPA